MGPLILVVDDFLDGRELLVDMLSVYGFRTRAVEDGPKAIDDVTRELPDLIIMDASLPGLDGWEVTRRLKRDPLTADVPVLMLTANAMPEHAAASRAAGCDAFLTKPVLPDTVIAEVRRLLDRARAARTLAAPPRTPSDASSDAA